MIIRAFLCNYQSKFVNIPFYPRQNWCEYQGCVIKHGVIIRALLYSKSTVEPSYKSALIPAKKLNNKEGFEQLNQYPSNFTTRDFNLSKPTLNK